MSDADRTDSPQPPPGPAPVSARWDLCSHLRLWPVAAGGLALDLWSKQWAFSHLGPTDKITVIPYLMSFQRSLNTGALFGLGKGWTPLFIAASLLALLFVVALFASSTRDRRSLHVALALVLAGALGNLYDRAYQIADVVTFDRKGQEYRIEGRVLESNERSWTIGYWPEENLAWQEIPVSWKPRVRQQGVVRDFVKMEPKIPMGSRSIELWPWVFNVADVLLVVGVGLLLLNFWWDRRAEQAARARSQAESACDAG